jgi:hypothetical protein
MRLPEIESAVQNISTHPSLEPRRQEWRLKLYSSIEIRAVPRGTFWAGITKQWVVAIHK